MRVKTRSLTGKPLNFAVARALGQRPHVFVYPITKIAYLAEEHQYSENWAQGGPIIERENIYPTMVDNCTPQEMLFQAATWTWKGYWRMERIEFGPTALIAAMRCYVASKLGDEVDVPDELV